MSPPHVAQASCGAGFGPFPVLPIGRELGNEPGMSVKLSASLVDLDRSGKSAVSCKDSIKARKIWGHKNDHVAAAPAADSAGAALRGVGFQRTR